MGQVFLKLLTGAVAGTAAWAIWEPSMPSNLLDPNWGRAELFLVLTLGTFVGLALGGLDGYLQGSRVHAFRGLGLGLLGGLIGASIGRAVGGAFAPLFPSDLFLSPNKYSIVTQVFARTLFMTPLGLGIGLGIGVAGGTKRRILVGALGGLVGGTVAGVLFDPVSSALAPIVMLMKSGAPVSGLLEVGIFGRALTGLLIGGGVGLFMGIFDRVTRSAWVRLVLGRNEGKEWSVDAPQTFIGRSEAAHVPLFGDNSIAPMHACIVRQGPNYILMDGGSPTGTFLNGQPVKQMPLFHGAVIRIGGYNLEFLMRAGAAPQYGPEAIRAMSYGPIAPQGAAPIQPVGINSYGAVAIPPAGATMVASPPAGMLTGAQVPTASAGNALVAMSGPLAGQRFSVAGTVEIGREASGIPITFDASASRRHASVSPGAAGLQLTDLNSTNGTFVNEQRVQSTTIKPGDIVRIGTTTFRVE